MRTAGFTNWPAGELPMRRL